MNKNILFLTFSLFVFLICLPVLLWIICLYVLAPTPSLKYISEKPLLLTSNIQTGDLLFCIGFYYTEVCLRTYQGSWFTHVMMAVRKKNHLYVVEMDNCPIKKHVGSHIMSLHKKIKLQVKNRLNPSGVVLWEHHKLYCPENQRPTTEEIENFAIDYRKYSEDFTFMAPICARFFSEDIIQQIRDKRQIRYCADFIIELIVKLKLAKKMWNSVHYTPNIIRQHRGMIFEKDIWWKNLGEFRV